MAGKTPIVCQIDISSGVHFRMTEKPSIVWQTDQICVPHPLCQNPYHGWIFSELAPAPDTSALAPDTSGNNALALPAPGVAAATEVRFPAIVQSSVIQGLIELLAHKSLLSYTISRFYDCRQKYLPLYPTKLPSSG